MRARNQTTLARPCLVSGRGYWSGESNILTFMPAAIDSGIHFVRTDLAHRPRIHAVAENRVSMPLRTRLTDGSAEVDMVEHVMAALFGLGIDNAEIHCTASEMPGLDGSSHAYVLALQTAGIVEQPAKCRIHRIAQTFQIGSDDQFIRVAPSDQDCLEIEYQLDYGQTVIGQASYQTRLNATTFEQDLAPARTFITQAEARALQSQGIATHVTERDLIVFDENGPVNNILRFDDECARHKALDLIGDLALAGVNLVGRVTARRSGHQMNGEMAECLREMLRHQERAGVGPSLFAA